MSDSELMGLIGEGNRAAFNELYRRFSGDVSKAIRRYTPANLQAEVEDIIQHFWLLLYKYAASYDPCRPLDNWMISCAVKAIASYSRQEIARTSISLIDIRHRSPFDLRCDEPTTPPARGPRQTSFSKSGRTFS